MNLLLLTHQQGGYTVGRLRRAARAHGHRVQLVDPNGLSAVVEGTAAQLWCRGRLLTLPDAVHWRPEGDGLDHGLTLLRCLEHQGVVSMNHADALGRLRPRAVALLRLAGGGIPVAASVVTQRAEDVDKAIAQVGGLPVVLRAEDGRGRTRSIRQTSAAAARAAVEVLLEAGNQVLVQAASVRSVRVLVVGGEAVGAVVQGQDGELKRARASQYQPLLAVALLAAAAMQLDVAGVDVGLTRQGAVVEGLTPSPALEAVETLCRVDAAGAVVRQWTEVPAGIPPPVHPPGAGALLPGAMSGL